MIFNSIDFLLFFPVVYGIYLVLNKRWQNYFLLSASYFFYGYWDYRYLSLLFVSTVIDYFSSRGIEKYFDNPAKKKLFLTISLFSNLSILGFFKYYNFFTLSAKTALSSVGWTINPILLQFALPLGISFYTFQTMSYTIDVYRGHLKPARDFFDFALFVSFFPQLVAGPIERATNLLPQVLNERKITYNEIEKGVFLILLGFFKKIYVADNISILIDPIFGDKNSNGAMIIFASFAHVIQVYGDFGGYSDIARGLSKLMGFELMRNFDHPLLSHNLVEFWRRWHISFMSWLRDYVYFSLGDRNSSEIRKNINNLFVFFLSGLWHGANWTFVVWGTVNGITYLIYKFISPYLPGTKPERTRFTNSLLFIGGVALTYITVALPMIFFRSPSIDMSLSYLNSIVHNFGFLEPKIMDKLLRNILLLALVEIHQYFYKDDYSIFYLPLWIRTLLYVSLFYGILILGNFNKNAFIYFVF